MKRLTTIAFLILTLGIIDSVSAQVQVTLTLPNIGSPYLSDYISHRGNRVLTLTNLTGQQQSIYLHGKVEQIGAPGYYIKTKENFRPAAPIVLGPNETKTLFARDEDWAFVEERHLEDNIPATERRHIITSGILPEGEYQVCVQAIDFFTNRPVSPPEPAGCLFFVATLGSPPQIVQPSAGEVIDQEYPMISWIPAVIMQPRDNILYDLYVVELTSRALNPAEVVEQSILYRGGNPFVLENLRQTFYQILPGDPRLKAGSRYAIVVVAKDSRGSAQFENQGRSEIIIVDIASPEDDEEEDDLIVIGPPVDEGIVSLLPMSHLQGRLLYRFHEDAIGGLLTGEPILMPFNADNLIQLQPGNSLQNMGFEIGIGDPGAGIVPVDPGIGIGWTPPPPQYILPAGYNTSGGKPLKQAGIRFTARVAVGKKPKIERPEDLEYVGMGYGLTVTGAMLAEPLTLNQDTKVIAATTTDDNGNYSVSFLADQTFGVLATGPVEVQYGVGDLPMIKKGYGLYRVITMEVEEKWYCHPDIVIFLQPGQSLELPKQVVTVQSYNLVVKVTSAKTGYEQFAAWDEEKKGSPILGAIVKLGRSQYYHDNAPASFPKDEVRIEDFVGKTIDFGPHTKYLIADSAMTGASGTVTFRRLVKHDGIAGCEGIFGDTMADSPSDPYYLEAETDYTESDFNYYIRRKFQLAPCEGRLAGAIYGNQANEYAPRSADYIPPTIPYVHELYPKPPLLYANSIAWYPSEEELPKTTLMLHAFEGGVGDTYGPYIDTKIYETDYRGLLTEQFPPAGKPDMFKVHGEDGVTSRYVLDYFKPGFRKFGCNGCGFVDGKPWGAIDPVKLRMGERWRVTVQLEPNSFVRGRVVDEHGQPIYGRVKIGDGPWVNFDPEWEPPQDEEPLFQPGWQQFDFQLQQDSSQMQQIQNESFTNRSQQAMQNYSNIVEKTEGGYQVEYLGNIYVSKFAQKGSIFETAAQSGHQLEVKIQPFASNYFEEEIFYVDIPHPSQYSGPVYDLGTFVISERLKRPRIYVYEGEIPIIDPNTLEVIDFGKIPLEGAEVLLSNFSSQTTDTEGIAVIPDFGSPSNEFRLRVNKDGFVPYDQYVLIEVSKINEPYTIEVELLPGKTLAGKVTSADGGARIEGARIHTEIGNNDYGPIILETFTNNEGNYQLKGLPAGQLNITATKTDDPSVTYIGQSKQINTNQTTMLDFELEEAPFLLTHIWNLPVVLESVEQDADNWIISGAFVDLPPNDRFRPEVETQRLPFKDITVKEAGSSEVGEKISVEPVQSSIQTTTTKFRSVLNEAHNGGHIVEMSGPKTQGSKNHEYNKSGKWVWITNISIDKDANGNGHVKTRAFTGLEYMRFAHKYDGQFFLGETPQGNLISAYKGADENNMPEIYHLMSEANPGANPLTAETVPDYEVHGFPAVFDPYASYVHADTFAIETKLIVDLPLSNPKELIVSPGYVYVLTDKIIVMEGKDSSLEFDLENWRVKTDPWDFDPDQGGLIASGVIQTDLLELPAPHILIKPNDMILPTAEQMNLNQLTLGGVLDLDIPDKQNTRLKFDYPAHNIKDPDVPRWRVQLYHQQVNQPAAVINPENMPGLPDTTVVAINAIKNYSGPDGPEERRFDLTFAPGQKVNHYHVIEQTVVHASLYEDGVALSGVTDLGIPGMVTSSAALFIYTRDQGEVKMRIQSLNTTTETKGKVEFLGDGHHERIFLDWGHFEVTGDLRIYDDNENEVIRRTHHPDKKRLRAKLIKRPNNSNSCGSNAIDICIEIIDVDGGHLSEGNQKQLISLGPGNDGWKKVLQGSQHVVGNNWNELTYQAQFEGFGPAFEPDDPNKNKEDTMWFKVAGAIETDMSKNDQIQLNSIDTPFGGFKLTYIFSTQSIVGTLNISNFSMGAVFIHNGALQMLMGAQGFFLLHQCLRNIRPSTTFRQISL